MSAFMDLSADHINHTTGGGIPGVAANAREFHEFLDRLEVEIKTYGYQPKLNFVYGRKPLQ
jgi:hypothetical protein